MLTDRGADCAEWGLILFTEALQQLFAGEFERALGTLRDADAIGRRFAEPNVVYGSQYLRKQRALG